MLCFLFQGGDLCRLLVDNLTILGVELRELPILFFETEYRSFLLGEFLDLILIFFNLCPQGLDLSLMFLLEVAHLSAVVLLVHSYFFLQKLLFLG